MRFRYAILTVADSGPRDSLVQMLNSVGIECLAPNRQLRNKLRDLGCDAILEIEGLVKNMGYEYPMPLQEVDPTWMKRSDVLLVDVKAHRNGPKIWAEWPDLACNTLWYRINGGEPQHVIRDGKSMGDEINPPCPVLTPNQWYNERVEGSTYLYYGGVKVDRDGTWKRAYCCWPPFVKADEYDPNLRGVRVNYTPPLCLVHNLKGWGYGAMIPHMKELGVKMFGEGSPDGVLNHGQVRNYLASTLAYVHLKSNDAPGYALYEALMAGCPVIVSRRLIWRCKMEKLFIPGETCLVYDRETHDSLSLQDVERCTREINAQLVRLENPVENQRIGTGGRNRLKEIMWREDNPSDVYSLKQFLKRNYGE